MENTILDMVYDDLTKQISTNNRNTRKLVTTTEQSQYVDGIPAYEYADLPTTGLANGISYITLAWVTNGRKSGEGAGLGTGVLAIYNPATATWCRVGEDYNAVTI